MIRIAKALNRFWRRRVGSVFADRYFARLVEGSLALKRALAYVMNNARKHGVWSSPSQPDPYSSGPWYVGWWGPSDIRRPLRAPPVVPTCHPTLDMPSFRSLKVDFIPGRSATSFPL